MNTESHIYALILQALSVHEHKTPLMTLCVQDDAQQSQGGLTSLKGYPHHSFQCSVVATN